MSNPDKDFDTLRAENIALPQGIWSDGVTMWVCDHDSDVIYAYDMRTKARDPDKDFNTLRAAGIGWPDGIWSDGVTMWVVEQGRDVIYAFNLRTKARDPDKDFNTLRAAGNFWPYGIWSNARIPGVDKPIMWVGDATDKIFAYDLGTKVRVTGVPQISITPGPAITEGDNAVFTITAPLPSITDVVINLSTTQTGDFISGAPAATVTLSAGNSTAQYTIATVDDDIDEPNGSVTVTLQSGDGYHIGSPNSATVNVSDNDALIPAVVAVSAQDEDGNPVAAITEDERVFFVVSFSPRAPAAADGYTDFFYSVTASGGYVDEGYTGDADSFALAGDTTATVIIDSLHPDGVAGPGGAIVMRLLPDDPANRFTNEGAGVLYTLGPQAAVTVAIHDADTTPAPPAMTITQTSPTVVHAEGDFVSFEIRAGHPPAVDLSVVIDITQQGDYLDPAQPSRITVDFPSRARAINIALPTRSNTADEADGVVVATLATPAAGANYILGDIVSADIAIRDQSAPIVGIAAAKPAVTEGADTHAEFIIHVARAQAATLTVSLLIEESGRTIAHGENKSPRVALPAGATAVTHAIAIADDRRAEDDSEIIAKIADWANRYRQRREATFATVIVHDDDSDQTLAPRQTREINQAIAPQVAAAVSRQSMQITQARIAHYLNGRPAYHVQGSNHLAGFLKSHGNDLPDMDIGQLDFSLPLQGANRDGGVDHLTVWRQHYQSGFSADNATLSMATGAVTGSMTGIDARINHNTLFGVGFNQSHAESDFEHAGLRGRHVTQLTGIRPYLAWQGGHQSHIWGSLGLNRGEIEITMDDHPADARRFNVTLANVHLGGQGMLYRRQSGDDATMLNLVADTAWSGMESTDADGFNIHDGRIRIGADYHHRHNTAHGWTWERNLEMTIRRDLGDVDDNHSGIALDGKLHAHAPHSNIRYRLTANTLRGYNNTRQWGVAGDITLSPDARHHGLSLSFKPQWGIVQSHGDQLWRHGIVDETNTVDDANPRYAIAVQYGIALTHEAERLTLFARDENNTTGMGINYRFGDDFTAGYEALDAPDADTTIDHRGTVRYQKRF